VSDPRERLLVLARDRMPLQASLLALRALAWLAPAGPWAAFARVRLGLRGPALRRWSRRAWWGRDASHAVRARLDDPRRAASVERRIDVDDDVPEAIAAAPLLVGAHVGPSQAAAHAVSRVRPKALFAFWRPHGGLGVREYLLADASARRLSLAVFAAELKQGGQVFAAADGGWNDHAIELPFLGGRVRLSRSTARLARRTGVVARPIAAGWEGLRIRIRVGAAISPAASSGDAWEEDWLRAYLAFLEPLVRDTPENLRLEKGGLWGSLAQLT
jgi:hypothetical protein